MSHGSAKRGHLQGSSSVAGASVHLRHLPSLTCGAFSCISSFAHVTVHCRHNTLRCAVQTGLQTALDVAGFGVDKAPEAWHPFGLKVHGCHHKDPAIVVDFKLANQPGRRDWIGRFCPSQPCALAVGGH